jgi:hypothetical protein
MAKKFKVAVAFTLPSYYALINEEAEDFDNSFYGLLRWNNTDTLLHFEKVTFREIIDLAIKETYFLEKIFYELEEEEHILMSSQLKSLTTESQKDRLMWNTIKKYIMETYSSEDILQREYRDWFIVNRNSIFARLFKKLESDPTDFAITYFNFFISADIIIPFSNFVRCDYSPIDLSFYLSSLSSDWAYGNYWLFYFPLRFTNHIRCSVIPLSELIKEENEQNFLKFMRKHHRIDNLTFQIYGYSKNLKESAIRSNIVNEFKRRLKTAPFIEKDWFELLIAKSFYDKLSDTVKSESNKSKADIHLDDLAHELAKLFEIKPTEPLIVDYVLPFRVINVESKHSVKYLEWSVFGRRIETFLRVYYCSPTKIQKAKIKYFTNPHSDLSKPAILDTSMLYSDVWNDEYFVPFLEYFLRDRTVIIPSLSLYELFVNPKWKNQPPIIIRELKEKQICKDIKIETSEHITLLTLISTSHVFGNVENDQSEEDKKKVLKHLKEKSRSIRDINTLLLALEYNGILITADEELHKFAFSIGIPSVRYIRRAYLEKIIQNSSISHDDKKEILNEIDTRIMGMLS